MSNVYELPESICPFLTAAARVQEIKALYKNLDKCEHGARGYQSLPRHMQRRAVSTNSQRLPLSMRKRHNREIGDKRKISKRPTRKYKRRPIRLVSNYNQRQEGNCWLQTHIWHAKHFHMIKRWGYSLPKTPTVKSYRATLRAARNTCLIQDVSYETCFELQGTFEDLIQPLETVTSSDDYDILKNYVIEIKSTWIDILLYEPKMCPFKAVGSCQIMFASRRENDNIKLWIFVHPSVSCEVLKLFINIYSLEETCEDSDSVCMTYSSSIKLISLKDSLAKFRLSGPESCQVLKRVLIPSIISYSDESSTNQQSSDRDWWKPFYANKSQAKYNDECNLLWNSLNEPPKGLMFGLTVRDPRFILPKKKSSVNSKDKPNEDLPIITECSSELPIFCADMRNKVNSSMISTHDINTLRANILVPGTTYPLDANESRIPVLLLGRGSVQNPNCGMDLILPHKWAACTWIALAHNGAAAAGQDEEKSLIVEFLSKLPPYLMPDTQAGAQYAQQVGEKNKTDYFKRPQNCRLNFLKQGVDEPFIINWLKLIQSWDTGCQDFFVLRERRKIDVLASLTCKLMSLPKEINEDAMESSDSQPLTKAVDALHEFSINNSLIYVHLIIRGKGTIEDLAMICLPRQTDFDSVQGGNLNECEITEQNHTDSNAEQRKLLRETHKAHQRRLRRLRKKAKERILTQEISPLEANNSLTDAIEKEKSKVMEKEKDIVLETELYEHRMNSLWVESKEEQDTSRQIMGYATDGRFSIRMGRSGATGFVVATPLLGLIKGLNSSRDSNKVKQVHVLVRNPSSMQYRWARLVVLKV